MVRSDTDNDKGTAPPKPILKVWTMGSIPATDKDFLGWCEDQTKVLGTRSRNYGTLDAMKLYMQHLNLESRELYERQLKERKDQLLLTNPVDAVPTPEPSGTKAPDDTDGTTMNIPNPQNISSPNSQNISFPNSQNITSPDSQNITSPDSQNIFNPGPQDDSAPPIVEPSSQISPTLPTAPRTDQ
jgi:hypothetical protein